MGRVRFQPINEGTTGEFVATLNTDSQPITAAELTVFDELTGAIVNNRNAQNVLNANGVTIAGTTLTWKLSKNDTISVRSPRPAPLDVYVHTAIFVIRWNDAAAVARQFTHIVDFAFFALAKNVA
jgi:hypothetical protein